MLVLRNIYILKHLLFVSEMQMELGILYLHFWVALVVNLPASAWDARNMGLIPGQEDPNLLPTPVFLPGELRTRRSPGRLQSIRPQREWDTTEHRHTHSISWQPLIITLLTCNWLSNNVQVELSFPILKLFYLNSLLPFLLTSYVQAKDKL